MFAKFYCKGFFNRFIELDMEQLLESALQICTNTVRSVGPTDVFLREQPLSTLKPHPYPVLPCSGRNYSGDPQLTITPSVGIDDEPPKFLSRSPSHFDHLHRTPEDRLDCERETSGGVDFD